MFDDNKTRFLFDDHMESLNGGDIYVHYLNHPHSAHASKIKSSSSSSILKRRDQNNDEESKIFIPTNNHEFQNMRIHFDMGALESSSSSSSNNKNPLDDIRLNAIRTRILPLMGGNWSQALLVRPVSLPIQIPQDACYGYYNVNPEHVVYGIPNVDTVVYVSAYQELMGQDVCVNGSPILAAATGCHQDQFDRPVIGLINICLGPMEVNEDGTISQSIIDRYVSVSMHEFAHVLGMDSRMFRFFRNTTTGKPLTPRPFLREPYRCVNGRYYSNIIVPSCQVIQRGRASNGQMYFQVVTPTVRQVVRNQFNCQSLKGARLENQPTNADCFGAHWDERYFYSELMSGIYATEADYFSPLTLALLEDSGWYRANFSTSQISPFGHGAGCDFVEKNCIDDHGNVPEYSMGFFCNHTRRNGNGNGNDDSAGDSLLCDPSHTHKARCDLYQGQNLPRSYQYFPDKSLGPEKFRRADYCPVAQDETINCATSEEEVYIGASSSSSSSSSSMFYPFGNSIRLSEETFGPQSKCFEAKTIGGDDVVDSISHSLCLQTQCIDQVLKVFVKKNKGRKRRRTYICDRDHKIFEFESSNGIMIEFQCPRLAVACPEMFCPGNCAGKGICNYTSLPLPKCECFDPSDKSLGCFDSFLSSYSYYNTETTEADCFGDSVVNVSRKIFDIRSPHLHMALVLGILLSFIWCTIANCRR